MSGLAVEITTVRLPRMIAPIPVPATIPPARNNARLGGDVHAETASRRAGDHRRDPGGKQAAGRPARGRGLHDTPAPKARKIVNPVSAGEGWCKGPARNVPASPANSPPTANAVHTPVAAARNWLRPFAGALSRCGRYFGRG